MTILSDEQDRRALFFEKTGRVATIDTQSYFSFCKGIEAALAKLREQEPIKWTHSCNALCLDNVELWIDRCPHCGKPADHPMPPKEQK